jgi:peroxiredoxin
MLLSRLTIVAAVLQIVALIGGISAFCAYRTTGHNQPIANVRDRHPPPADPAGQGPGRSAGDEAGKTGWPAPSEQLKSLVSEYEAALEVFREAQQKWDSYVTATNHGDPAKTGGNPFEHARAAREDYQKARQAMLPSQARCAAGCVKLAEEHPRDPAALDALLWMLCNITATARALPENAPLVQAHDQAVHLLRRDHLGSDKLGVACRWLGSPADLDGHELLEQALTSSPHRAVRALALLTLADKKLGHARTVRELLKQPERVTSYERIWGKEVAQAMLKTDPDRLQQEGQGLYERLAREYADVPDPLTGTLGNRAALRLAALRQPIAAGQMAPEIEAADIGGNKLKLSHFRGKAVLLVFTGDWCAACGLLYPQQRSLAKKLAGRPCALVDVNADLSLERRKRINVNEGITWPAFQACCTNDSALGPIPNTRWGIEAYPTLFLIDHEGVIRQKYVGTPGEEVLTRELEPLVQEAEAANAKMVAALLALR